MGLLDQVNPQGKGKDLGSQLELVEQMQTYTVQRRLRSAALIFQLFAYLSIVPLIAVPMYVATDTAEWLRLLTVLISLTALLLLFAVVFLLYAILNLLERR